MKLWFLEYMAAEFFADEAGAFVVSALTEQQARHLASKSHLSEGAVIWFDSNKVTCEEIDKTTARVIIQGW